MKYVVTADDKLIDGQVERIQKQFGLALPQEEVVGCRFNGNVYKRRKRINNATTISLDIFKDKATADKLSVKKWVML
jgi:trigger factor